MSRILSVLKRIPDNGSLPQDICAGFVICMFVIALAYGLAGLTDAVEAARARP